MGSITLGSSASAVVAYPELSISSGVVNATSVQSGQHFNKRYANVMRTIKSLLSELPAADQLNFEQITTCVPVAGATNAEGSTCSSPAYSMSVTASYSSPWTSLAKRHCVGSWPTSPPSAAWRLG